MTKNILLLNILSCCVLLVGCNQSMKNQVFATRSEKIELCQNASDIFKQHHAQYEYFELKKTRFSVSTNGNALVHFELQPEVSASTQQLLSLNKPKLILSCEFNNDYEYRFLSRYQSK